MVSGCEMLPASDTVRAQLSRARHGQAVIFTGMPWIAHGAYHAMPARLFSPENKDGSSGVLDTLYLLMLGLRLSGG